MTKRNLIILILVILAATLGSLWYFDVIKLPNGSGGANQEFIQTANRNLTQAEKEIYLNRLNEGQKQLDDLNARQDNVPPSEYFKTYWYIGTQYYGLGELGKARENYELAIKANEENYNGYTALYTVTLEQGDINAALSAIQKANNLNISEPDIWKKLISLKQDKFSVGFEELDQLFKEALEKTGNHIDIIAFYAQFLEKNEKLKEAEKQWEEAVKLRPDNGQYKTELERVQALTN